MPSLLLKKRIVIAHTEVNIGQQLEALLKHNGYECLWLQDETALIHAVYDKPPDMVLIDWVTQFDVFALIRRWRTDGCWQKMPVLVLARQQLQSDKIAALNAGVDDWITAPLDEQELLARVAARLRRSDSRTATKPSHAHTQQVGLLILDARAQRLSTRQSGTDQPIPVKLGPTEYRLIQAFIDNQDLMMSRELLKIAVWGRHSEVDERSVDVHIKRLREAILEVSPLAAKQIETVRGMGYRLASNSYAHG